MKIEEKHIEEFYEKISDAENFLLITHRKPDADAIGSSLALHLALEKMGKDVTSVSIDQVSPMYYFLPRVYLMGTEIDSLNEYDQIIILDCGDSKITGFHTQFNDIFSGKYPVINIDHHVSNDNFGDLNMVYTKAASTSQILFELFNAKKIEVTKEMATLLLSGLYYDTGSFKHDNTTSEVLETASKLAELGGDSPLIAKNIFNNHSIGTLRLWGRIFSNMKKNKKNIISSIVTKQEIKDYGINSGDINLSEAMNYLDSVPESRMSVLLTETEDKIKGSFRTSSNDIDVSKIAQMFKGGGHKKAAGFVMDGCLKDIKGKIIVDE